MLPLSKGVQQESIRVAHQKIFDARMFDQQKPADTEAIFARLVLRHHGGTLRRPRSPQAAPVSSHSFRGNNQLTKFVTRKVNLICKAGVQSS
jgi:hypothetical protein